MTTAYVGIGSNVGNRQQFCRQAVRELGGDPEIDIEAVSGLYETTPIGPPQRSFVNLVVRIKTALDARGLFERCKAIEQRMGREPADVHWGPRVIDLDLLLFGDEKIVEPDLEVPHPRIRERRFVLVPLFEIDPDVADPWETPYRDSMDDAVGDVEYLEPF
jgi:2-amino-4-hydroxy-6-hydroxymethyldihydropteridine diphosphokinase